MPRRKRHDTITSYHLQRIEKQVTQLELAMGEATLSLTPLRPHYDALMQLRSELRVALNLLSDRPADYFRHCGHMSPGEIEWHRQFTRKPTAPEGEAEASENDR